MIDIYLTIWAFNNLYYFSFEGCILDTLSNPNSSPKFITQVIISTVFPPPLPPQLVVLFIWILSLLSCTPDVFLIRWEWRRNKRSYQAKPYVQNLLFDFIILYSLRWGQFQVIFIVVVLNINPLFRQVQCINYQCNIT